ncbi:hypothetical protein ACFLSQ_07955 [Bacteroidota bacterium]
MKKLFKNRQSRIRLAAIVTMFGLITELYTIFWIHSFSFIIFVFLGLTTIGIGISFFLTALIKTPKEIEGE